jgi:hypothetical protein
MTQTWPGEERRKHWRYPCAGDAWVRTPGADVLLQAQLSDISLGGCYLDMMNPLPSETEIELTLSLSDRRVRARGTVRGSRQGFGMGIAFTEVVGADRTKLQELINFLAGSCPVEPALDGERPGRGDAHTSIGQRTVYLDSGQNILDPLKPLLEMLERKGVVTPEERVELSHRIEATLHTTKRRLIPV